MSPLKILHLPILLSMTACGLLIAGENASNPLASVDTIDLRYQAFDLDNSASRHDLWIDGSWMADPKLKIKYELHYWETNVTGSSENGLETFHLKPIYFAKQGAFENGWKYKVAVGGEWIVGFDNEDKGIGSGSDQLAPLCGVAFVKGGTVIVPLAQHFISYDGPAVNNTAFRLIAIQALPHDCWFKMDAKAPIEWDNNEEIPATAEFQLGHMFNPTFGLFFDALIGVGGDRPYDYGGGIGFRFNY